MTTTNAGVKTIFVSGQVRQGATLREHVESALWGVVRRLEQARTTPSDVVKFRIFVKDFLPEQYPVISEVQLASFPEEDQWPTSTELAVRGRDTPRGAERGRRYPMGPVRHALGKAELPNEFAHVWRQPVARRQRQAVAQRVA